MLINLQFLRFAAALCVVLHHAAGHVRVAGHEAGWLFGFGHAAGFAGVDLFFVISGFIMVWTTRDAAGFSASFSFLRRRVARIYSGYWPFCLLALALFAWMGGPYGRNVDLLGSLALWPTPLHELLIPVSWTLIFEMGFYVLFTGMVLLPRRVRPAGVVILFLAMLGWALYTQFVRQGYAPGRLESMSIYEQYLAFPYLLEFLAGAGLAQWLSRRPGGRGGPAPALDREHRDQVEPRQRLVDGDMLLGLPRGQQRKLQLRRFNHRSSPFLQTRGRSSPRSAPPRRPQQ